MTKSPLASSTLWANAIMGILAVIPGVTDHVNPGVIGVIITVLNFLLRFKTDSKISFKKPTLNF